MKPAGSRIGNMFKLGKMSGRWLPSDLLAQLKALDAYSESLPRKARIFRNTFLVGIFVVVVFWILYAKYPPQQGNQKYFMLVMGFIILLTLIALTLRIRLGRTDVYNREASGMLQQLLHCILEDLDPKVPVRISASLKSPTDPEYKVDEKKHSICVETYFRREIFDLECRLRDGTRMQASIADHTMQRVCTKRKSHGRVRKKEKSRRKVLTRVRLLPDPQRSDLKGDLRLPSGISFRLRRGPRGTALFLTDRVNVVVSQRLDADRLLAMLSGGYGAIVPVGTSKSKPVSKRESNPRGHQEKKK